jgi:hypothetical protein
VRVDRAVAPFAIIFVPAVAILLLVALIAVRAARHHWHLAPWAWVLVLAVSTGGTLWFLYSRAANPRLVPFFGGSFALLIGISTSVVIAGLSVARRLRRTRSLRVAAGYRVALTISVAALLFVLAGPWRVPIPDAAPAQGNAASSLRASAGDLARFLLEAARPTRLPPELGGAYSAPQVRIDEQIAWGLGIGVQTAPGGRAVFHWGRNPAVRAAMVMYLDRGDGVVVLANDGQAGDVVAAIALRAVEGPRYWTDQ